METLADRAYRVLRKRILSHKFSSGHPLPQARVARELGVGTIPLREAMIRLNAEGLIETVPHWGAQVRAWSLDDLTHLHELRVALECQTARLCATRVREKERSELLARAKEVDALYTARPRDHATMITRDAAFHARIAELAESPLLLKAFRSAHVLEVLLAEDERFDRDNTIELHPHMDVAEAIAAGDAGIAYAAMRQHLSLSPAQMAKSLRREC